MAYSNRSDWNRDRDYERRFSRQQQDWDEDSRGARENMERDYYGAEGRGGYGGGMEGQGSRMQRGYGQGDYDQRFGQAGTQYGGGQGERFSESGYGRGREYLGREGRGHYGNDEGGWQGREREQWRNRSTHGEYDRGANYGGYSSSGTGNYGGYGGSGGSYEGDYRPGQGGYSGQSDYRGQSGHSGQSDYRPGQGGYSGQSDYRDQGGYSGQSDYRGQGGYGSQSSGQGGYGGQGGFGRGALGGYRRYGRGEMWNEGGRGLRDMDEGYRSYGQGLDWREGGYGAGGWGESRYGRGGFGQGSGRPSGGQAYERNYGGGPGGSQYGSQGQYGSSGQGQSQEFGQHRGRGPRGYRRSDDRIREEVCDCLSDDDRLDASNIEVTVKDGEVQLSGTVTSRDDKRYAETLVERVSGVKEVQNSLRLQQQQEQQRGQTGTTGQTATSGGTTATGTTGKEKGREMPH